MGLPMAFYLLVPERALDTTKRELGDECRYGPGCLTLQEKPPHTGNPDT